jgi:molybdenum cofactor biosynthesis enzyme MoaA
MSRLVHLAINPADHTYRPRTFSDDPPTSDAYVQDILSRVGYPKRLFRGLDDIPIDTLEHYLRTSKVYILGLRLTNVCNYDCVYCGTSEKRGRDSGRVLRTPEYLDLISQAADLGIRTILFGANGEPLLTRDLPEIIEHVASLNMVPILFTNASLFGNDELCRHWHGISGSELLRRIDAAGTSLMISCESLQADVYDRIMRVKSFDSFRKGIDRIRNSSLAEPRQFNGRPLCRIGFSVVMMPVNYGERHDLIDFAHALNGLIILKPPSLHGSAKLNIDQMFSTERVREIRPELQSLSDKAATLQILTLACASWTLGLSISNEGEFMACMTEEMSPFDSFENARNTPIKDLIGRRVELVTMKSSICPVKDKFYSPPSPEQ